MRVLVSSAKGANGDGYGTVLAFDRVGHALGSFSEDRRVVDPRGLCVTPGGDLIHVNSGDHRIVALDRLGQIVRDTGPIDALDLGGGVFGPDGRYYAGSRNLRTVMVLPAGLDGPAAPFLPARVVPFPRGFAFAPDGRAFLASGIGPSGTGEETVKVFDADRKLVVPRLVDDPQLSPLDLMVAPNGNVVVSSEWPFGAEDAISTVREYDSTSGRLVRTFEPDGPARFRNPRGLRFGPDGNLYCVGRDEVIHFDFETGAYAGAAVTLAGMFGQAVEFFG
jgi:DNA-binding beta-propeller fold protein YncE